MNSQDARIARIYTTQSGNKVGDPTPNAPDVAGKPPATAYDLVIEIEAGNSVIDTAPFTLLVTALDETTGAAVAALDPAIPAQKFSSPPFTNVGLDFVLVQTFSIAVPAGVQNHLFHYNAVMYNSNFQIVSIATSDRFLLV
ncbi:hypothetical protein [Nonomuraea sp. NPDC049784]|uniref:hypothetical protein n=1 Tax=Nonomuraea sp. NPDC049784 TaxID=3154361 RepID=UPI0033EF78B1